MYFPHCQYPLYADLAPQEKIDAKDRKYYLLIGAFYIAVYVLFLLFF